MIFTFGHSDIFIGTLLNIFAVQDENPSAPRTNRMHGRFALQRFPHGIENLPGSLFPGAFAGVDQLAGLLGIVQHGGRIRQRLENEGSIPGVVQGVVESHGLRGNDTRHFHGGLQAGTFLQAMHVAEKPLDVAQGSQRDILAMEESDVLVQHADIVAAPGQQRIVFAAPGGELQQRFPEIRGTGQFLAVQSRHAFNPRMDPQVMGGRDRDGNGFRGGEVRTEAHGADLDHFKNQFIADLAVGAALIGYRLVPFQVQDDIGHNSSGNR